jgi:xanthine dehydrogenase accessory factor
LLIASRRKADKLRGVMRMRGIDQAQLARLQAPAGPDAGAKTPAEIALVAIVGVLSLLRGRAGLDVKSDQIERNANLAAPNTDGKFINPVCGMAVRIAGALHVEQYQDVAYYFCCDGCKESFVKDPAKYAAIHQQNPSKL